MGGWHERDVLRGICWTRRALEEKLWTWACSMTLFFQTGNGLRYEPRVCAAQLIDGWMIPGGVRASRNADSCSRVDGTVLGVVGTEFHDLCTAHR